MLQVQVYVLETEGQVLAGTITLEGKKLTTQPVEEKYINTLENLISEPIRIHGMMLDPADPDVFIRYVFLMSGTYLRCSEAQEV